MHILPPSDSGNEQNIKPVLNLESSYRAATRFLVEKDPTGALLSTVTFMDSVENWVLRQLDVDGELREEVTARQRRLSEILTQYREHVPPDNHAFLQLLSWMKSSEAFYTLDYLTQFQPQFTMQLIDHCKATRNDDVNANLALERIRVVFRTKLADRVFSPENFEYVMTVIIGGLQ